MLPAETAESRSAIRAVKGPSEYAVAYALHTLEENLSLSELQAFISGVNSHQRVKVKLDASHLAGERFAVVLNCKDLARPALYILSIEEYEALQEAARQPYHIQGFVDQLPPATLQGTSLPDCSSGRPTCSSGTTTQPSKWR